jgi:hypothetical protein
MNCNEPYSEETVAIVIAVWRARLGIEKAAGMFVHVESVVWACIMCCCVLSVPVGLPLYFFFY